MNKLPKHFALQGQFLKKVRYRHNLSQSELAEKLGGVTPQFISNIENGIAGIPPKYIKKISSKFDVKEESIIGIMVVDFHQYLFSQLDKSK